MRSQFVQKILTKKQERKIFTRLLLVDDSRAMRVTSVKFRFLSN